MSNDLLLHWTRWQVLLFQLQLQKLLDLQYLVKRPRRHYFLRTIDWNIQITNQTCWIHDKHQIHLLKQMLSPNDAVNWLRWCVSNCTPRECFLRWLWPTFIALCQAFLDKFDLTIVTSRSWFNQWNVCRKAHSVDMITGLTIIECIQDSGETFIKSDTIVSAVGRNEK